MSEVPLYIIEREISTQAKSEAEEKEKTLLRIFL